MTTCSVKGCHNQAMLFLKSLKFCREHATEIGILIEIPKEAPGKPATFTGEQKP